MEETDAPMFVSLDRTPDTDPTEGADSTAPTDVSEAEVSSAPAIGANHFPEAIADPEMIADPETIDTSTITPPVPPTPYLRRPSSVLMLIAMLLVVYGLGFATGFTVKSNRTAHSPVAQSSPVTQSAANATVQVTASSSANPSGETVGTGVVINASGIVVTNNHVITGASTIIVYDPAAQQHYTATVLGYSRTRDVAVLQLADAHHLPAATLGSVRSLLVGTPITAIGHAAGLPKLTYAAGQITALNQSISAQDTSTSSTETLQGLVRTSADVVPGDSGGPLVAGDGSVIAINVAASAGNASQSRSAGTPTVSYAIPMPTVLRIVHAVLHHHPSATVHVGPSAALGVVVMYHPGRQNIPGVPVKSVIPGDPAALAGLVAGSTITAIDLHPVTNVATLVAALASYYPGQHIALTWVDPNQRTYRVNVMLTAGAPQ